MKKIKYLLFILFLGLLMLPVVFAEGKIEITSVELDTKSDNTVINSEPTFSGLQMNYDVDFSRVGDFVKYKIVVRNNTDKDYELSKEELVNESKYLKYSYDFDDILKAKSETSIYLIIKYVNEIDDEKFINGTYVEDNTINVALLMHNNVNPNTSAFTSAVILLVISSFMLYFLIKFGRKNSFVEYTTFGLLLGVVLIPLIAKAVEEYKLQAVVRVSVSKKYKVIYDYYNTEIFSGADFANSGYERDSCNLYYFGSVSEENKYYECRALRTKEDSRLYSYGEKVEVMGIKMPFIFKPLEACTENYNEGYILCHEKIIEEDEVISFRYFKYYDDLAQANADLVFMDFKYSDGESFNLGDSFFNQHLDVEVEKGNTFTMPGHDVRLIAPDR